MSDRFPWFPLYAADWRNSRSVPSLTMKAPVIARIINCVVCDSPNPPVLYTPVTPSTSEGSVVP